MWPEDGGAEAGGAWDVHRPPLNRGRTLLMAGMEALLAASAFQGWRRSQGGGAGCGGVCGQRASGEEDPRGPPVGGHALRMLPMWEGGAYPGEWEGGQSFLRPQEPRALLWPSTQSRWDTPASAPGRAARKGRRSEHPVALSHTCLSPKPRSGG